MKIINYGHACFKVISDIDGVSVVFDPYRDNSVPNLRLPNNIESDYVFSSHDHYDHDAVNKIRVSTNPKPIKLTEIVLPHDKEGGKLRGMSVARIIRFSDYSICHLGDIGDIRAIEKHNELKGIDIVLCPINGFFTISAEEAIKISKIMNWKIIIPMHYEKKELGIGYPDGGQIDIFKKLHPEFDLIKDNSIEINDKNFEKGCIIFE